MNAQVQPIGQKPAFPVPQRVWVSGKVTSGRIFSGKEGKIYFHLIKTKAKDEYSHPGTLEVSSPRKLAGTGEEWEGWCEVTGYPHSFDSKDKATGEISTIHTAKIQLHAVED